MLTFITEQDARRVLRLEPTIDAVEDAFRALAEGRASVVERRRVWVPEGFLAWMPAAYETDGLVGAKLYTTFGSYRESYLLLFDAASGRLRALVQSYYLSLVRTGAATAVATRHLARRDARVLAMVGTGSTALLQIRAVAAVRPLTQVRVFSRRVERREALAAETERVVGVPAVACASVQDVVESADVVVTSTDAAEPIVERAWLKPGAHVNAIGSNFATRREIGPDILCAADRIVADALTSAREEAGDLILGVRDGAITWEQVNELAQLVSGQCPGRTSDEQLTLFKSVGVALEDLAAGRVLLDAIGAPRLALTEMEEQP